MAALPNLVGFMNWWVFRDKCEYVLYYEIYCVTLIRVDVQNTFACLVCCVVFPGNNTRHCWLVKWLVWWRRYFILSYNVLHVQIFYEEELCICHFLVFACYMSINDEMFDICWYSLYGGFWYWYFGVVCRSTLHQIKIFSYCLGHLHCFCEISEFYTTFAPKSMLLSCAFLWSQIYIYIYGVYVALYVRGHL